MCPYPFDFECSSERLLRRDRELRKRGTKNPVTPIPVNSGQPLFGPPFALRDRANALRSSPGDNPPTREPEMLLMQRTVRSPIDVRFLPRSLREPVLAVSNRSKSP